MTFGLTSTLLDACTLGVVSKEATYGYDLTQKVKASVEVSESTLYPVLRRLFKEGLLETYDEPFDGRNRRYYKITSKGEDLLGLYTEEWNNFKAKIDGLLKGGENSAAQ
ncbi:MAG: PadR family transcriptional regulator [Defluviitaleaceae bacterium]|nr:PadR family transcriptional regulator [Defluviitaleaceae bacterium]